LECHATAKGNYVMTCGQDKTIRLWNPHRDGLDAKGEGLLVKTYQGRHGYDVQDVAVCVPCHGVLQRSSPWTAF
jgi:hypothetical protein